MSLRKSTRLTPRRVDAARHNSQRSTGPRSEAGKERMKMNALKHGCDAAPENEAAVLRVLGEDHERYAALKRELATAYGPGDALLRLGGQEQVPMGIEYVSRESLEKLITEDFHNTTVEGILEHLLGSKGYCWRVQDDVVDVSHKSVATGKANLSNHVLPTFVIRRCSVADASNVLYMSLNSQLHSEVTGYAGDYNPGDPQDLIGPLEMRNTTVRQILNRLVSANNRAAWVIRVQPGRLGQLPTGGLWTIIEYENPPR